jgi:hypothetical protein
MVLAANAAINTVPNFTLKGLEITWRPCHDSSLRPDTHDTARIRPRAATLEALSVLVVPNCDGRR